MHGAQSLEKCVLVLLRVGNKHSFRIELSESREYHVQRRALLTHDKHAFVFAQSVAYYIDYRLRFARSGRSVYNDIVATVYLHERVFLRVIKVVDGIIRGSNHHIFALTQFELAFRPALSLEYPFALFLVVRRQQRFDRRRG